MRTLTTLIALIVIAVTTIFAQPFFINEEPSFELVEGYDTWDMNYSGGTSVTITEPKGVHFSEEEMKKLLLGGEVMKTRNVQSFYLFSMTKGFETSTLVEEQTYILKGDYIVPNNLPTVHWNNISNNLYLFLLIFILFIPYLIYFGMEETPGFKETTLAVTLVFLLSILLTVLFSSSEFGREVSVLIGILIIYTVDRWLRPIPYISSTVSFFIFYKILVKLTPDSRIEFVSAILAFFSIELFLLWLYERRKKFLTENDNKV